MRPPPNASVWLSLYNTTSDFISLPLGGKQGLKGLALKIEGSELDNFCHYNSLLSTPLAHWCHTRFQTV